MEEEAGGKKKMLSKSITPKLVFGGMEPGAHSEVYATQYSPDGTLLACSCGDASIRVYRVNDGKLLYHLKAADSLPMTCLRYRPVLAGSKTRNVLISGNASGTILHWHVSSGKVLHKITEQDNQVFCLDYKSDGTRFASAGQDYTVRVYDEATKSCIREMRGSYGRERTGHSNRIFSVKYSPIDENILLSAGWDNTVLIWDMRADTPVRSIFGPHVCGDGIDMHDNLVLTGSYRPEHQLQLWDFGSGEIIQEYDFSTSGTEPCLLYAARFSRNNGATHVLAGGAGSHEARVFERDSGVHLGTVRDMTQGVYSIDTHPDSSQAAIASGDGTVRLIEFL